MRTVLSANALLAFALVSFLGPCCRSVSGALQ